MALAWLRSGLGVRSGISATAGERYSPMAMSRQNSAATNRARFCLRSATGSSSMSATARQVPTTIKGSLLPNRVSTLSDREPKRGKRKTASTLSPAMMAPVMVSFIWKVPCKINGTRLSYICQNALMDKKASPMRNVLR